MNTPNKLTILRILLVPVFLVFLLVSHIPHNFLFALLVFGAASVTDALDGHLARKNNQITTFGKFLDPLADKILVISAMVCFIELGLAASAAVVLIIAREFMVTSLRLVAVSSEGRVIAAGVLGKVKTAAQMVSVVGVLALYSVDQFVKLPISIPLISQVLIWICAVITIVSGVQYLVRNWGCVNATK